MQHHYGQKNGDLKKNYLPVRTSMIDNDENCSSVLFEHEIIHGTTFCAKIITLFL